MRENVSRQLNRHSRLSGHQTGGQTAQQAQWTEWTAQQAQQTVQTAASMVRQVDSSYLRKKEERECL